MTPQASEVAPDDGRRVGEETWEEAWPRLYDSFDGNPWAAMPSLHFATSRAGGAPARRRQPVAGAAGWAYALTLGFALVYLGEHYVIDLVAGAALVALVRRGEPLAEPLALTVSRASAARAGRERVTDAGAHALTSGWPERMSAADGTARRRGRGTI